MWLYLTVLWVGLQCVIVIFPEHTHLLEIIKLFITLNSTKHGLLLLTNIKKQTIVGILTFNSRINTISKSSKVRNFYIFHHFSFYEQLKFHALLS